MFCIRALSLDADALLLVTIGDLDMSACTPRPHFHARVAIIPPLGWMFCESISAGCMQRVPSDLYDADRRMSMVSRIDHLFHLRGGNSLLLLHLWTASSRGTLEVY